MSTPPTVPGVEIASWADGYEDVLTAESLGLLARLQREFGSRRKDLLEKRAARDAELAAGALPDFLSETSDVRGGDWTVAPPAPGLVDRRVEITGPTDRKMVINALNSRRQGVHGGLRGRELRRPGDNLVEGQRNLRDAVLRKIDFTEPRGQVVRARRRGRRRWSCAPAAGTCSERHVLVDGEPVSGSLFDFAMYFFHNAQIAARRRHRPVLLPAEDGEPPRGAAVERRVRLRAGGAGHPDRDDPGHRA